MSPVVTRRMRPMSDSAWIRDPTGTGESEAKSPPKKKPRLESDDDVDAEDPILREKRELARTIAEFRVGFPSSTSSILDLSTRAADLGRGDTRTVVAKGDQLTPAYKCNSTQSEPPVTTATLPTLRSQIPLPPPPVVRVDFGNDQTSVPGMDGLASCDPTPVPGTGTDDSKSWPSDGTTDDPRHATSVLGTDIAGACDNGGSTIESRSTPTPASRATNRRGFSPCERELLEAAFHIAENPGTATMKLLVHLTGLSKKKIRDWFRTRRSRKQREAEQSTSEEGETSSDTNPAPRPEIPPQYWPEPLRNSHMQLHVGPPHPHGLHHPPPAAPYGAFRMPGYGFGLPYAAPPLPPSTLLPHLPFGMYPPFHPMVAGGSKSAATMPPTNHPSHPLPEQHPAASSHLPLASPRLSMASSQPAAHVAFPPHPLHPFYSGAPHPFGFAASRPYSVPWAPWPMQGVPVSCNDHQKSGVGATSDTSNE